MTSAKPLWLLIAASFVLKALLMPFTLHSDLIFVHAFPFYGSYEGVWNFYGAASEPYLRQGFTYYAPLVYYFIGGVQWFVKAVNPGFQEFMLHAREFLLQGGAAELRDYLASFSTAQVRQFAFWMKFPYLLLDVFIVALLLRLRQTMDKSEIWLRRWLFHPVLLFSVYIFGQYRLLPVLLLWLVIDRVYRNKNTQAALLFGLLCLTDNFPFFLLFPAALVLEADWKGRLRFLVLAGAVFGLVVGPLAFLSEGQVFHAYYSPLIQKLSSKGIFHFQSALLGPLFKALFTAVFAAMAGWLWLRAKKLEAGEAAKAFSYAALVLLLSFYAFFPTTIHYFLWTLPFWIMLHAERQPWPGFLSVLLVALLFLFNLDTRALNLGLLAPVDPVWAASQPSLHEFMDRFFSWGWAVAGARALFSILCLLFAWSVFKEKLSPLFKEARP